MKKNVVVVKKIAKSISKRINEEVPTNVNVGGCAVFAYLLIKELKKHGYEPELVFLTNRKDKEIDRILKRFECGEISEIKNISYDLYFMHCCVKVDSIYIDSDGIYEDEFCSVIYTAPNSYNLKNIDLLKSMAAEKRCWNGSFDRKYILKIAKIIRDTFCGYSLIKR